jgi:hypothetical protein
VSGLPPDWRDRLVAALTAPERPLEDATAWFGKDPRRTPDRQLEIYREQIRLRSRRVLRGAVAGLAAFEGDAFDALADGYLRAFPPRSWTLHSLADDVPEWLAGAPSGDPARDAARRDLASLDLAIGRARRAAAPVPLAGVDGSTPLRLAPAVTVLALERPWHIWRRSLGAGGTPPPPALVDVVVYRRDGEVRDQQVEVDEARLLRSFGPGTSLADAVTAVAATLDDPGALLGRVGPWFERFAARGWIERA